MTSIGAAGLAACTARAAAWTVVTEPMTTTSTAQHAPNTPRRRCQRTRSAATRPDWAASSTTHPLMTAPWTCSSAGSAGVPNQSLK